MASGSGSGGVGGGVGGRASGGARGSVGGRGSVGRRLLLQRPDLVRRVWVPILVRVIFVVLVISRLGNLSVVFKPHSSTFIHFHLWWKFFVLVISRLGKLSVVPRPRGLEAEDLSGEEFSLNLLKNYLG